MLQLSVWHDPSHRIHCFFSEGHRQLKCQAYTLKENTVQDYFSVSVYDKCISPLAGWCIYVQSVRCAGLTRDLVEGATEGRREGRRAAALLNYNMDMILVLMYTAAVVFIVCICLISAEPEDCRNALQHLPQLI